MHVRFFDPGKQYEKYKPEIDQAITRVLTNGDLILRADVEQFEQDLAAFVGTKYAVGLNSGTDALYLALWHLGVGPGDEVLVPSHTFVATAQVVKQLGATPVLYDMDAVVTTTEKTKGIIVAHIAGAFFGDMEVMLENVRKDGLFVIEDACQALGAVQNGKKAGSFGIAGAFSFYPAKILGAVGDAGALVTNDEDLYTHVKELRNHCKTTGSEWGVNSRLDNIQAAVLNVKLKYLPDMLAKRESIARLYLTELDEVVGLPDNPEGRVWQDFIIHVADRDELYEYLKQQGVETMKNEYPFPIQKLPQSLEYEANTLRIPCNDVLLYQEALYVIEKIKEFYRQ